MTTEMVNDGRDATPAAPASRKIPILWIVAVALLCGALAYASIVMTRGTGRIAAVWIPNALLVAILGRRVRDPVAAWVIPSFIANIAANILVGDHSVQAVGLAGANLVEIVLAVTMLRRIGCARPDMGRLHDLGRFCLIGGVVARQARRCSPCCRCSPTPHSTRGGYGSAGG